MIERRIWGCRGGILNFSAIHQGLVLKEIIRGPAGRGPGGGAKPPEAQEMGGAQTGKGPGRSEWEELRPGQERGGGGVAGA